MRHSTKTRPRRIPFSKAIGTGHAADEWPSSANPKVPPQQPFDIAFLDVPSR